MLPRARTASLSQSQIAPRGLLDSEPEPTPPLSVKRFEGQEEF